MFYYLVCFFKGEDGDPGLTGEPGDPGESIIDGYTPVKGAPGLPGDPGDPGRNCSISTLEQGRKALVGPIGDRV